MKEKRSRLPLFLGILAVVLVVVIAAMFETPKPTTTKVEQPLKAEAFLK